MPGLFCVKLGEHHPARVCSQTAAPRRLGRSLQAVNRSLAALEQSVGVELVRRTTRKSFATEPA
jgi:DNA-binding transcriptional LysR family regulator